MRKPSAILLLTHHMVWREGETNVTSGWNWIPKMGSFSWAMPA